MFRSLTRNEAVDMLMNDQYGGWSYEGAAAMVECIEAMEEESGQSREFDAVAIRCDWSEYASAQDAAREFGWVPDYDAHECDESWDTEAIEWLRDRTTVIEFDRKNKAAVIVQAF